MEIVKDSLSKEENVYLRGFGSFTVKKRAKKTARNISKNTTIIIVLQRWSLVSKSKICKAQLSQRMYSCRYGLERQENNINRHRQIQLLQNLI